jgi:hypothetical protein
VTGLIRPVDLHRRPLQMFNFNGDNRGEEYPPDASTVGEQVPIYRQRDEEYR